MLAVSVVVWEFVMAVFSFATVHRNSPGTILNKVSMVCAGSKYKLLVDSRHQAFAAEPPLDETAW
ncbi:hypothetical protein [Paraburkholderia ultramafica]|uniref:hypothetical protein n=1 Tax=Paraburkholderia ultramafica TaxID=1544867 RepID=UPI001C2E4D33|nr:hypothetical protein [Paraburkholderia ultramafica]